MGGIPPVIPLYYRAQVKNTQSISRCTFKEAFVIVSTRCFILKFEHLKSLYGTNEDFGELYSVCLKNPKGEFLVQNEYLFKGTRLCVPRCGTCELVIREVHGGSLAGHYGENKTLAMLREHYFGPGMSKEVQDCLKRCATCQVAKSHSLPQGLYTPLSVLSLPWVDVSMNFILSLSKTQRNKDSIFVVEDKF